MRWIHLVSNKEATVLPNSYDHHRRNPEGGKSGERAGPYLQNGVEVADQVLN